MIVEQVLEYSQCHVTDGIIHGVKIVGTKSRNGRRYPQDVLTRDKAVYEGAAVFVLHPTDREKRKGSRQLGDHFGSLSNIHERFDGNVGLGLFGDLTVKQAHPMAGLIMENLDKQFGLSHNAHVEMNDEGTEVTRIVSVNSVDLVDNPATTNTLFEEVDDMKELEDYKAEVAETLKGLTDTVAVLEEKLEATTTQLADAKAAEAAKPKPKGRLAVLEDAEPETTPAAIGKTHDDFLNAVRGYRVN